MKEVEFVEKAPARVRASGVFVCGHCRKRSEYLEERGLPLASRGQVFPGREYVLPLLCPSCFKAVRSIKFVLEGE